MKQYIHYGQEEYDPALVTREHGSIYSKPDKGLWGSPVNTDWGWINFCKAEGFRTERLVKSFRFRIDRKARILKIRKEEDILPYVIPDRENIFRFGLTGVSDKLNREKLYERFDGMELYISDNYGMHDGIFYSWDCDSVVVWNPKVILPIKRRV